MGRAGWNWAEGRAVRSVAATLGPPWKAKAWQTGWQTDAALGLHGLSPSQVRGEFRIYPPPEGARDKT